jgi:protein tyrosine/serine phosphatase
MHLSPFLSPLRPLAVLGLIVAPVVYASHQQKEMRNFRVVRDGVLCRSGQMSPAGLRRAVHDYGIRTIVSLRDAKVAGAPAPDAREEEYCDKLGLKFVRIGPLAWEGAPGEPAPVQKGIDRFLEVMHDPANYPVLLHCFAGTHRTGGYVAIYRMEFEGYSNQEAIEELKSLGYPHVAEEKDIFGYLSSYRPHRP